MKVLKICLRALNFLVICLFASVVYAQTPGVIFTTLATFDDTNNGAHPYSAPVLGADGNLYGTLPGGGTNNEGVIFQVGTNGLQNTLYTFNTWDGANPIAPLVLGRDGNLYGVAIGGGTNNDGTIFEITTNGTFTLLYSFGMMTNSLGHALDGSSPYGGLVQGRDGNFYGTTTYGGVSNVGTIFQFSTNGALTTLHSFTGSGNDDGAYPYLAPLVEGADGVFYGTTYSGGTNNDGTIFQITADGSLTNLHEFNNADGLYPYAGMSVGLDGNLYGTTTYGGTNGYGTAFQITTSGTLTTLFEFGGSDGLHYPVGGVVPGNNNTWFGTTYGGGASGYGTVFQLTTNGVLSSLYSFTNGSDGADLYAGVVRGASGTLYGAAYSGGDEGDHGTIFSVNFSMLLSIITPTRGEYLSNSVFAATGTASANAPGGTITNVTYSFNSAVWTNAISTNGWINWSAELTLVSGTNTLSAAAVDDAGNLSATDTVIFIYVPVAPLTVLTNGEGTITPNYNHAVLPLGARYTMIAKAASGFAFSNWTGGTNQPLSVLTNATTLQFVMTSNLTLQANFVDMTKPTLTITAPKANQLWSNAVFTVTGTAKDNWPVANVFYSLNNSVWSNALTSNQWSNWTAQVTLIPGTNTIAAYAMDGSGLSSTTNSVKLVYILSAPLTVLTNGEGTISPNYNNSLLQIGAVYSMKAKASSSFAFTNWTDGVGNVLTNGATLKFIMASNLTFIANFVDVTKPTLTITSPKANQHMTNALATVVGTASDNLKVAGVWYQLNGGSWSQPLSSNGWTNWTATVELRAATNTVKAYATDLAGNFSATNSVSFVSSNSFLLQLSFPSSQPLTAEGLNFALEVSTGLNGHIQVSSNLADWEILTNFTGTNASLNFHDAAATNINLRFYRAVIP